MLNKIKFFQTILLPSLLAVLLFLIGIYMFVLPDYRESLMNGKRETIRELSGTAWSVMHKLNGMIDDEFTLEDAQKEAAVIIGDMRYGDELKDYFWITDTVPRMIMHPYKPSLIGTDLSDYKDTHGKNFFVEIVDIIKLDGQGYVDYKWQWKDDSLTVVPKLSFVKEYEPWGWIVGTGIYIEDVKKEISKITRNVLLISIFITLLVGGIIAYLARRNYLAEIKRQLAQERLRDTLERYKKLVEASTDGVMMVIENEIVYCNPYLLILLGFSMDEFEAGNPFLIETLTKLQESISGDSSSKRDKPQMEISLEHKIRKKDGSNIDVIINRSKFEMDGKQGEIYTVKDVSGNKDVERELDLSLDKFRSIAGLMDLGIFRCTLGRHARFMEINRKALELLGYISKQELEDTLVIELFAEVSEKKDVIRAITEGMTIRDRILRLKRADGNILPALISLFPVNDAYNRTIYCDGIIIDAYDHLHRKPDFNRSFSTQQLSANILLHPIKDYLMPAPLCDMDTTVSSASKLMKMAKADILLVKNDKSDVIGLITHSDISRRVVASGGNTLTPVSEIMSAPVISVNEGDMVMDAFNLMMENHISYVVVKADGNGNPSYISLLRLSELRKDTPEYFLNTIQKAGSVTEISVVVKKLPGLIKNLVESGTGAAATGKLISKVSDVITEKIINEVLTDMGEPPVPFAFLALGSEGRREQTLATDQDNAIVYQTPDPERMDQCKKFFLELGQKVCTGLDKAGYPFCKGGVMAMNEAWCMSLKDWESLILEWLNNPNPKEILNTSIFFDFRPVYGDFKLAEDLQKYCHKVLKNRDVFFFHLARSIINLNLKNTESGLKSRSKLDIKLPVLAIASIARLWALRYGIGDRNTSERLYALESINVIPPKQREEFDRAFRFLTVLRIRSQILRIEKSGYPDNEVDTRNLAEIDLIMIRKICSAIMDHQNRLGLEFRSV